MGSGSQAIPMGERAQAVDRLVRDVERRGQTFLYNCGVKYATVKPRRWSGVVLVGSRAVDVRFPSVVLPTHREVVLVLLWEVVAPR